MTHAKSAITTLTSDSEAATIVEFAFVAPVLILLVMGTLDIGHSIYTRSVLEGEIQKAARASTMELRSNAFRAGVLLWCAAWHQVPAGSLPDDDVEPQALRHRERGDRTTLADRELGEHFGAGHDGRRGDAPLPARHAEYYSEQVREDDDHQHRARKAARRAGFN